MSAQDLAAARLPVEDINEALPHLRRPFTPAAVKWKVQSVVGANVLIVAHIDARLVVERLNAVVGGAWFERYTPWGNGGLACELTVLGQSHVDVGTGGDSKSLYSDALKRVAVKFGIGVSVYALPRVYWPKTADGLNVYTKNTKQGPKEVAELKPDGMRRLAGWAPGANGEDDPGSGYALWLARTGTQMFGPVLDHGDEFGAEGMDETRPVETEAAPEQQVAEVVQVEGLEADALRAEARARFDQLRRADVRAMLPARFNAELTAAGASVEDLRAFVERVDAMAREKGARKEG